MGRRPLVVGLAIACGACATAAPPSVAPKAASYEEKLASILRLEDMRILRDEATEPAPPTPPPGTRGPRMPVALPPPPPDLVTLVRDGDARIRRRAAIAIGRVHLSEGVPALVGALADVDGDVRQAAAFGLGLLQDRAAVEALTRALGDAEPLVQGRAAEALGLIGVGETAAAIGSMAAAHAATGALSAVQTDDLTYPLPPPVEAVRLAVYALARLKSYDGLAAAVLDERGEPRVQWWPVAYALRRCEDPRALPGLRAFVRQGGSYAMSFAIQGLGVLKDLDSADLLLSVLARDGLDDRVRVSAIRALAAIGESRATGPLLRLLAAATTDRNVKLESVIALGQLRAPEALEPLQDVLEDRWPAMRAAAQRAYAEIDPIGFITVLSGLDEDGDWSVRAALAGTLASLPPENGLARLTAMLNDRDERVVPAVLRALVRLKSPGIAGVLMSYLAHRDVVVRSTAASLLAELGHAAAAPALTSALESAAGDSTYIARAAILDALTRLAPADARPLLDRALGDPDWAVRVRAARLLEQAQDAPREPRAAMRPAPTGHDAAWYAQDGLTRPSYSPHAYIETDDGTIEIELAVLDAPLTVHSFVTLARQGFFNGLPVHRVVPNFVVQDGDPRGDGEGGPGYTLRDELNMRPYLRGTVGMALDWEDTGGSQFFLTHAPQPHLDGRYTVFGHVIDGLDVLDHAAVGDVIRRVRIWDGIEPPQ